MLDCCIMNKDDIIGEIQIVGNKETHRIIDDRCSNLYTNIDSWISERVRCVNRHNVYYVTKLADMTILEEYIKVTYALSLNDTIWIKQKNDNIKWSEISLYRQDKYNKHISEIVLDMKHDKGIDKKLLRTISPDFTTVGSADKCWVKKEQQVPWLYKTSEEHWGGLNGTRPYCEYYANQLVFALVEDKTHYVPYGLQVSKTPDNGFNKGYCFCPLFTSEKLGYISYHDSEYKLLTLAELDEKLKSDRDRQIIREMLLIDSIVLNYDRHQGNYGFLFNNDTFKIIGVAPIFDQDCSLGNYVSLQSVDTLAEGYEKAKTKMPRTNMGTFLEQARWALTSDLRNKLSEIYPFRFKRLPKEVDLEDERIQFMEYILNSQIQQILGIGR